MCDSSTGGRRAVGKTADLRTPGTTMWAKGRQRTGIGQRPRGDDVAGAEHRAHVELGHRAMRVGEDGRRRQLPAQRASNPATVPNNGLVLFGTHPSDSAGSPFTSRSDPNYWATLAGFAGQSETDDQASSFVMCATANGTAHTTVVTASTVAANAIQESSAPTVTTAACPQGDQLLSGGVLEDTPGQVNDGSTSVDGGNLKPVASYPSDSSGAMASNGSTSADSWSTSGTEVGNNTNDPSYWTVVGG